MLSPPAAWVTSTRTGLLAVASMARVALPDALARRVGSTRWLDALLDASLVAELMHAAGLECGSFSSASSAPRSLMLNQRSQKGNIYVCRQL